MKITGTVKAIFERKTVSEKFTKQEFVLTDNSSQFPQTILFECGNQKCDLLTLVNEGQRVDVSFDVRGREWTNQQGEVKYFNTLSVYDIVPVGNVSQKESAPVETKKETPAPQRLSNDTLPF